MPEALDWSPEVAFVEHCPGLMEGDLGLDSDRFCKVALSC